MKGRILLIYLIIFIHTLNGDDSYDSSSYESREDELSIIHDNVKINRNSSLLTTTVHEDDKLQEVELTTNSGDHQTIYYMKDLDLKVIVMKQPHDVCLMYKYTEKDRITGQLQKCLYRVTQYDHYNSIGTVKRICEDRNIQFLELLMCTNIFQEDVKFLGNSAGVGKGKRKIKVILKRAVCLPVWESYRIETTCLSTTFYTILQTTCVTNTEYFYGSYCLI
ncbi:uncharacterized protein LOC127700940 [Mytilus californianus]|uniref:uncharacterized protein LOC127700940 n=1 Tax=Mytilus californianus TaxID=6549 RepID=UPI002247D27B|nr:uncharacterized protein LOC127700940 [Mytilus californianus]